MTVLDQLELYVAKVDEMADTRLIRNGFNPDITMSWNKMQGLRFESRESDEDNLRSFLVTFRQFISEKELVYLRRIYRLCHQHIRGDELREHLRHDREMWKQMHKACGVKLTLNGRDITPEYVADLWVNGYYFHSDPDKRNALTGLLSDAGLMVRFTFLNFLVEGTRQVLYVRNMIGIAQREALIDA